VRWVVLLVLILSYNSDECSVIEHNRKEAEKTKREGDMCVLLLEVLHCLVVEKEPRINIGVNNIVIHTHARTHICMCIYIYI
jgi:hypothetical protein